MNIIAKFGNKYDFFIVTILVSMIFGNYGGSLQAVRVLSILLIPQLLKANKKNKYIQTIIYFFSFWFIYSVISFLWTPNIPQALKEISYYPVHMLLFVELCVFSRYAINTIQSICIGWLLFVIFTGIVGIWEITTDQHLPMSSFKEGLYLYDRGEAIIHHFASVTFQNYNSYVVLLVASLPFIINLLVNDKTKYRNLAFATLLIIVYILAINASRGGLLSLIISIITFVFYSIISKNTKNLWNLLIITICAIGLFLKYSNILMQNILIRSQYGDLYQDNARSSLIADGIHVVFNEYIGLGSGIGGGFTAMEAYRHNGLSATHNLFLEIFVNFGLLITTAILIYIFRMLRTGLLIKDKKRKLSVWIFFLTLIPFSIIDSGYLLTPQIWLYFASIFVFVYYDSIRKRQTI